MENGDFHSSEASEYGELDRGGTCGNKLVFETHQLPLLGSWEGAPAGKVYAFTGHARNAPKTAPKRCQPAGDLLRERRK